MAQPRAEHAGDVRAQVLNVIDFLSAYDAQRNPPIRRVADHGMFVLPISKLPAHPCVRVRPTENLWLTVDFLDLPPAPSVPEAVAELLVEVDKITAGSQPEVIAKPEQAEHDTELPPIAVSAEGDDAGWVDRTAPARNWIEQTWRAWSVEWHAVRAVKQLHRSLFEQRERLALDRDAVELVWGFGRLRWTSRQGDGPPTPVDHPLLTIPVEIDAAHGSEQLRVRPAGALEVDGRLLIGLEVHDRAGYMAVRQAIASDPIDPWIDEDRDDVLRRLIRTVDNEGVLLPAGFTRSENAVVDTGWTMFLRRRVPDSEGFLQAMRELYVDDLATIPAPLRSILTTEEEGGFGLDFDDSHQDALLLPLPANEQQQRILRLAQRHPGVAVQGPPGTGKSHTIANLISHYVAHGKRVLVVAEKEQALKVLADKVPESIRDLTVSVLGADEEGRRRLGRSITRIQTRVGQVDKSAADARIVELTSELSVLDRRYTEVTAKLLQNRQAEISELPGDWLAGQPLTPQLAAGWVADQQADLGYIPDGISDLAPAPLTRGELAQLIDLGRTIGQERARLAGDVLPDRSKLANPVEVAAWLAQVQELSAAADWARQVLRDWPKVAAAGIDEIHSLENLLIRERDWYIKASEGWLGAVLQQLNDPLLLTEWAGFVEDLTATRERVVALRAGLRAHTVQLPDQPLGQFLTDLTGARDRLVATGKLGLFARDAKRALEQCLVDGAIPTTADQVQLCLDAVEVERLRARLVNTWRNQTAHLGAPSLTGYPEQALRERLEEVVAAQSARQRWLEFSRRLEAAGFPIATRPDPESLDQLASLCQDAVAALNQATLHVKLAELRRQLSTGAAGGRASPEWMHLADAVAAGNVASYQAHWDAVGQLEQLAGPAARLTSLLQRLAAIAPEWAGMIGRDPAAAGRAADLNAAWQWRQVETWLTHIASLPDPALLQASLEQLTLDRRRTVTELVTERAWRRLADNLGRRERQALQSYVAAVTRYGKTGGKYAQRWIGEMRAALDEAKTAVPVWIMPTARALSSFRPTAVPPFDVLIIDEASQIGFEAMPLLALATSTIVVGDDKQTSPEHVGLDRERIFDLMDDYLRQIPRYRTVFDPDRSLYDLATLRFSTPIMLTEHFRCLPEIIAFSNRLAYGDQIIPLRDQPPHPGWIPLGLVRVLDGFRSGYVNEAEAAQVVSLIRELCDNPNYDGMTFGVISLLGTQQSKRIWDLLYDELGPDLVAERQIRCGEPANFQGDERDVMVLSTVVATDPSASTTRFSAMTGNAALRRINVAASRARNQMWVVTSVDPQSLPAGDLRAELIRHCAEPPGGEERKQDVIAACESEFERRVVRCLQARGYRSIDVQHQVGQYRIDVVVAGPNGRLAIECDGDRWHGEDVWHKDRARQEVLERAGWTFERIRGSSFFRDPGAAMEPVWRRLETLGIPVGDEWIINSPRAVTREVSGTAALRVTEPAQFHADDPESEPGRRADESDPHPQEPEIVGGTYPVNPVDVVAGETSAAAEIWTPPAWYLAGRDVRGPVQPAPSESNLNRPRTRLPTTLHQPVRPAVAARPATPGSSPGVASPPTLVRGRSQGPTAQAPTARAARTRPGSGPPVATTNTSGLLRPFRSWTQRQLPPVDSDDVASVMQGFAEIIQAEGPMHAVLAYQRYAKASGGHRVGRETHRLFDALNVRGVRTGHWLRLKDRVSNPSGVTLYAPNTAPVVLRLRGPREIVDIPRSEIRELMETFGLDMNPAELKRAVFTEFGFVRMTERTSDYLDQCLRYKWTT